jgi:carboxyl-terminal processing protease
LIHFTFKGFRRELDWRRRWTTQKTMNNHNTKYTPTVIILGVGIWGANLAAQDSPYPRLFDEVCEKVESAFYDAKFVEEKFSEIKQAHKRRIAGAASEAEFSKLINAMLENLQASHTNYYTPHDYAYYHLAAIFSFLPEIKNLFGQQEIKYPSIGIITQEIGKQIFIASILSGSAAEKAGLQNGDEILSVDGEPYSPIQSLQDKIGGEAIFKIRRTPSGSPLEVKAQPVMIDPKQEFLEAQRNSIRIYEQNGRRIGYVHLWSYAGEDYHNEFLRAISSGELKSAEALIFDLRYGWGGASPEHLKVFTANIPVLKMIDREGKERIFNPRWDKPVAMLVNGSVRSGKELLAFGFKKYKLGTVIGERTAGATLGGRVFVLSNKAMLFLAVQDSQIDNVRLEGIGVEPDITVRMDIRYCQGRDGQIEAALAHLLSKLH